MKLEEIAAKYHSLSWLCNLMAKSNNKNNLMHEAAGYLKALEDLKVISSEDCYHAMTAVTEISRNENLEVTEIDYFRAYLSDLVRKQLNEDLNDDRADISTAAKNLLGNEQHIGEVVDELITSYDSVLGEAVCDCIDRVESKHQLFPSDGDSMEMY